MMDATNMSLRKNKIPYTYIMRFSKNYALTGKMILATRLKKIGGQSEQNIDKRT